MPLVRDQRGRGPASTFPAPTCVRYQPQRLHLTALSAKDAVFYALDLSGAQMQGAHWRARILRPGNLRRADLRGARMAGASSPALTSGRRNWDHCSSAATGSCPSDLKGRRLRHGPFRRRPQPRADRRRRCEPGELHRRPPEAGGSHRRDPAGRARASTPCSRPPPSAEGAPVSRLESAPPSWGASLG